MKINKLILTNIRQYLIIGLFLLIPTVLLFINILFLGSPNWGDAPHFFPNELNDLFAEPLSWVQRGSNFGGVSFLLSISPIMFLYGTAYKLLGLSSEMLTAMFLYVPGVSISLVGSFLLAKSLKLSNLGSFFVSLVYTFNTYFLLLIDGGQVGMVLAYGIFPLCVLTLNKLITNPTLNNFYVGLIILMINSIADARVALISLLVVFIWSLLERGIKNLRYLVYLFLSWIALSLYWIIPLLKNSITSFGTETSSLHLTSILHPMYLFSPHWPGNVFGKIQQPLWYFGGLPLLIFLGFIFTKTKRKYIFLATFLFFAFLAKGNTYPFGNWYDLLVNLPFGFAFRDSSKFFIPVLLFAGLLIANTVEMLTSALENRKLVKNIVPVMVYIYIVLLISPALIGKLNFVLSNRHHSVDYQTVYQKVSGEEGFFRTVWFPERHPLATEYENKPALDAFTLVNQKPFARMNSSEDWFNFLNTEDFVDWFKVLGIKYLILSDDPRAISKSNKELENWREINNLLSTNKDLEKVDWGTSFPIYGVKDVYPHFYTTNKVYVVVGSDKNNLAKDFPVVYIEDGIFDPYSLQGKDPESVEIVFGDKENKIDLSMSFLQKYFVDPTNNTKSEWISFTQNEYLKSKYQLTINDLVFNTPDYNSGIAFSTKDDEEIEFTFDVFESGEYIFARRVSDGISQPVWITEQRSLIQGKHTEVVVSKVNQRVLNIVALIPKSEFDRANGLTNSYLENFKSSPDQVRKNLELQFEQLEIEEFGALTYKISHLPKNSRWIIMSDNYNKSWKIKRGNEYAESLPIYSMINGFYVHDSWTNLRLEFLGQRNFRWGMYFTSLSTLIFVIYYFWKRSRD